MNRIVPLILAVALFMELMDSTVIATSLPAIAADINTDPIALKLAMTSYLVALAIFIPVSAWIGDRFGVRRVFSWAIFVFMLGSVACALSYSLPTFVAARFFQGMGGAMMTPLARLVLMRSTPKSELVNAISWLTVPALIGPMVGPPIGGFLTTYLSWHWIFLVNIPIGAVGIVAIKLFLPPVTALDPGRIDWLGFVYTGIAFAGILFGLSVISLPALPPLLGAITFVVGVVALAVYVVHALRVPNPLLDLALFKSGVYRAVEIASLLARLALGAWPFLLPLMLQIGFGLTPFDTGMIMLYAALASLIAKFIVARIFSQFGFRNVMIVSGIAMAGILGSIGFFTEDTPVWIMVVLTAASGFSRSVFFSGGVATAISELPDELTSHATATSAVLYPLGLALGVALAGGLLDIITQFGDRGGDIQVVDFQLTFFIIGGISLLCCIPFFFLPKNAGENISGHSSADSAVH